MKKNILKNTVKVINDNKKVTHPLSTISFNIFRGYFRNLFMSWSLFWGFFMLFLCFIMIPWFIFQIIDIFSKGFYNNISNFLYNLSISKIIYPYLQNYTETLKESVSWFLFLILPLIVFITQYIFKKSYENLEHKFVKKYFLIITPVVIVILILSLYLSSFRTNYPLSSSIIGTLVFFIIFSIGSFVAYLFYIFSETLENIKFENGKFISKKE